MKLILDIISVISFGWLLFLLSLRVFTDFKPYDETSFMVLCTILLIIPAILSAHR